MNKRQLTLRCSWFLPRGVTAANKMPCVVYLHGNSSSRLESLDLIAPLLLSGIMLASFDFSGSGMSDGEYISLGHYEKDDIETVLSYLRSTEKVSMIGLWGRSMGAVTTLMYADKDHSLAGICLDSPFCDLRLLCSDLVSKRSPIPLPDSLVESVIQSIRETIKTKAHFDILDLNPLKNNVSQSYIPACFIAAKEDELIPPNHSEKLHEQYMGDKSFKLIDGTHNSVRPPYIIDSIVIFFVNCFSVQGIKGLGSPSKQGNFSMSSFDNMLGEDAMLELAIKNSLKHH